MGIDSTEATLVLMRRGPYVLLGTKKKARMGTGKLNAPGGRLEPGEAPLRCAVREVEEEVGITLDPDQLQLIAVLMGYAAGELDQKVYVYFVRDFHGEPRETDSMIPEFVPIDGIPFGRMHGGDVFWFSEAVQGKMLRLWVWYESPGEGYIEHKIREGDPLLLGDEYEY